MADHDLHVLVALGADPPYVMGQIGTPIPR